ncbi:GNAT family N-acetyltransferase [Maridesulfovibrio ferrireducens]|uniref:GNAT family N-acetyltransferase n=1 Tax=Maridesulfovibrio ferrireducens TaxID=246191 RepID=UPI001A30183D|nr:GNAT family N-acetyltransferase [Maridesulfovibrio ferrireducens]MBI9110227.1 GNAT family N-acetyltransferase [Maridesulfovibrio ferrireducens]
MKYIIEEIQEVHDSDVCRIIKKVGAEYGAIGDGFGPSDPEVSSMSKYYKDENKSVYLVATIEGTVVGGSGIAPFNNSSDVCELRKLFLLPESRGLGLGKDLTLRCLSFARSKGYKQCYLDTLSCMKSAIVLYENLGFTHLKEPLDGTIHGGCDVWMLKEL